MLHDLKTVIGSSVFAQTERLGMSKICFSTTAHGQFTIWLLTWEAGSLGKTAFFRSRR